MTWLEVAEMRFLSSNKGCTRVGKIRSEIIRKEPEIPGKQAVRTKYKKNWINHLERVDNNTLLKHTLNYQTPRMKRSWKPQETMVTLQCRNRSNDLIHGGR